VRTIARGMQTLRYKKALLNPFRYGAFAWKLFSHKVCRWLLPWAMLLGLAATGALSLAAVWARWALALAVGSAVLGAAGWLWPEGRRLPRPISLPAFLVAGNLAVIHAAFKAMSRVGTPTWEPTRRQGASLEGTARR
jgi:hypothetical protein